MTQTLSKVGSALLMVVVGIIAFKVIVGPLGGLLGMAIFLLTAVAFLDALINQRTLAAKAVWAALVVFVPVLGAVAYWMVGRPALPAVR